MTKTANDDLMVAAAISHLSEAIKILAGIWLRDDPLSPEEHIRVALSHIHSIERTLNYEPVYHVSAIQKGND